MNIEHGYFSMEDLAERGWSLRMTQRFYGEPEMSVNSGVHQKQWRFFEKSKIYIIEKSKEFRAAKAMHMKRSNQRVVRKLSYQAIFAYNFCKHFELQLTNSGSAELIPRALDAYDQAMMQRTGREKPARDRCWHHEISSAKLLSIILEYIRIHESNYLYARNYIDMLRIELTKRGAEFRDYQKCLSVLNKASNQTILNEYPDILMYCDDIGFEKEFERRFGQVSPKVNTSMYQ